MIITDYFYSEKSVQWDYAKQMGINHAVIRLPEREDFDAASKTHWDTVYNRFIGEGLTPIVLEPMPNYLHEHIKKGDEKRDECIEKVIKMLCVMDRLSIRTICFNFMAHIGWTRTSNDIKERGGATVTGFNIEDFVPPDSYTISHRELWYNLEYFLKAVLPYAQSYGIRLALHPDDPPVERLGGVCRILTSLSGVKKAIGLVKSDYIGATVCQGSFAAMGEDLSRVIADFAEENRIFYIHFRDIMGNKNNFRETFHDNGQTDMAKMIGLYKSFNVNAPIRVDHVPTMAQENGAVAGYGAIGRLFAVGYLKGLLDYANL